MSGQGVGRKGRLRRERRKRCTWGTFEYILPAPDYISSYPANQYPLSNAAVSSASEPWMAFSERELANFLRMVPSSALAGLVAPISLRRPAIASSFSRTIRTSGPRSEEHTSEL